MTYRGHVENGVVVIEDGTNLPEGAVVYVDVAEPGRPEASRPEKPGGASASLGDVLLRHAGKATELPPDAARNHDQYLEVTPGRPS